MNRRTLTGRVRAADRVGQLEQLLYLCVAIALGLTGIALLAQTIYAFVVKLTDGDPFFDSMLDLLDRLLLVFIIAELLHTVRAIVAEHVLLTEPFLIVGIIASIRTMIIVTAEATRAIGQPDFRDLMIELGVLAGTTVVLGLTLFLIRHTVHAEPRPSHEASVNDSSPDGVDGYARSRA